MQDEQNSATSPATALVSIPEPYRTTVVTLAEKARHGEGLTTTAPWVGEQAYDRVVAGFVQVAKEADAAAVYAFHDTASRMGHVGCEITALPADVEQAANAAAGKARARVWDAALINPVVDGGLPATLTREAAVTRLSFLSPAARSYVDLDDPHTSLRSTSYLMSGPPEFFFARDILRAYVAHLDAQEAETTATLPTPPTITGETVAAWLKGRAAAAVEMVDMGMPIEQVREVDARVKLFLYAADALAPQPAMSTADRLALLARIDAVAKNPRFGLARNPYLGGLSGEAPISVSNVFNHKGVGLYLSDVVALAKAEPLDGKLASTATRVLNAVRLWEAESQVGTLSTPMDANDVADRLLEVLEADNGGPFPTTLTQRRALVAGVRKMLTGGCTFTDEDVEALAVGDEDDMARMVALQGGPETHAVLNDIFDGEHSPPRRHRGPRPPSRLYVPTDRQRERSEVYASFERDGQRECDVIEWLSGNYEPLNRRAIAASKAASHRSLEDRLDKATVWPDPLAAQRITALRAGLSACRRLEGAEKTMAIDDVLLADNGAAKGLPIKASAEEPELAERWGTSPATPKPGPNSTGMVERVVRDLAEIESRLNEMGPPFAEMATMTGISPWVPTPGARVRTTFRRQGIAMFPGSAFRRDNALGEVGDRVPHTWPESWYVGHDDGSTAPYVADELQPEKSPPTTPPKEETTHRCAGAYCPGLPYKASDLNHPATCLAPPAPAAATPARVVCFVTNPDGSVLLVRTPDRRWELPSGEVDVDAALQNLAAEVVMTKTGVLVALSAREPVELPPPAADVVDRTWLVYGEGSGEPMLDADASWCTREMVLRHGRNERLSDVGRDVLLAWARA